MTVASLARRLAGLEARRASPGASPTWLAFATRGELEALEEILAPVEAGERNPTEADQLLCIQIGAAARRRMLAGEPPS